MPIDSLDPPALSHKGAMDLIRKACTVTTLSYEEAIAVYLRSRHILRDQPGDHCLSAPVPATWNPTP